MLPSDPRHAAVAQLAQSGRIDEALALLNQLAAEGDAMSLFTLANFYWQGGGPKTAFLREVRDGACPLFSTVLSPDYNQAHRDHLHLDQAERGSSGWRMCR